jgi:hypothetical protein
LTAPQKNSIKLSLVDDVLRGVVIISASGKSEEWQKAWAIAMLDAFC